MFFAFSSFNKYFCRIFTTCRFVMVTKYNVGATTKLVKDKYAPIQTYLSIGKIHALWHFRYCWSSQPVYKFFELLNHLTTLHTWFDCFFSYKYGTNAVWDTQNHKFSSLYPLIISCLCFLLWKSDKNRRKLILHTSTKPHL